MASKHKRCPECRLKVKSKGHAKGEHHLRRKAFWEAQERAKKQSAA